MNCITEFSILVATLLIAQTIVTIDGAPIPMKNGNEKLEKGYNYPTPSNPLTLPTRRPRPTTTTTRRTTTTTRRTTTTTTEKAKRGYVYNTPENPFTFPTKSPRTTTTSTRRPFTIRTTTTTTTITTTTTTTTTRPLGYVLSTPENPLALPPRKQSRIEIELPLCPNLENESRRISPGVNCKIPDNIEYEYGDYSLEVEETARSIGGNKNVLQNVVSNTSNEKHLEDVKIVFESCNKIAQEGLIQPLPGINCIHREIIEDITKPVIDSGSVEEEYAYDDYGFLPDVDVPLTVNVPQKPNVLNNNSDPPKNEASLQSVIDTLAKQFFSNEDDSIDSIPQEADSIQTLVAGNDFKIEERISVPPSSTSEDVDDHTEPITTPATTPKFEFNRIEGGDFFETDRSSTSFISKPREEPIRFVQGDSIIPARNSNLKDKPLEVVEDSVESLKPSLDTTFFEVNKIPLQEQKSPEIDVTKATESFHREKVFSKPSTLAPKSIDFQVTPSTFDDIEKKEIINEAENNNNDYDISSFDYAIFAPEKLPVQESIVNQQNEGREDKLNILDHTTVASKIQTNQKEPEEKPNLLDFLKIPQSNFFQISSNGDGSSFRFQNFGDESIVIKPKTNLIEFAKPTPKPDPNPDPKPDPNPINNFFLNQVESEIRNHNDDSDNDVVDQNQSNPDPNPIKNSFLSQVESENRNNDDGPVNVIVDHDQAKADPNPDANAIRNFFLNQIESEIRNHDDGPVNVIVDQDLGLPNLPFFTPKVKMPMIVNERAGLVDQPLEFPGNHEVPIVMNDRAMEKDMEELNNFVLFDFINGEEVRVVKKEPKKFSFSGKDFSLATPLGKK